MASIYNGIQGHGLVTIHRKQSSHGVCTPLIANTICWSAVSMKDGKNCILPELKQGAKILKFCVMCTVCRARRTEFGICYFCDPFQNLL